jgi:hypothetical protein
MYEEDGVPRFLYKKAEATRNICGLEIHNGIGYHNETTGNAGDRPESDP